MTTQLPGDDKDSHDSAEGSMKQIVEYIRSYIKALLRKIDVQTTEHSRHETVRQGGRSLRAERGGNDEDRGLVPAPMA